MNKNKVPKLVTCFFICLIMASSGVKAETINVEKVNFQLGVDCLQKNDFSKAIKYFELVVKKNPKNAEARYNLALAYKKAGMAEKSVQEFDNVVTILNNPNNFQAKGIDINKIRQQNRVLQSNELASDKYELYSKVKSQENDYIDLGDMHYDSQQYETSIEYYNLALQINPYNDYTYFKIARSYMDTGNYIQAEPYISRATELSPDNDKYKYFKEQVTKNIGTNYTKNIELREKLLALTANKKDPMQGFEIPDEYKKELFADENNSDRPTHISSEPEPYVAPSETQPQTQTKLPTTKKHITFFSKKTKPTSAISANELIKPITSGTPDNYYQGKSQELDYLDLADMHYDNQEYDTAIEYYNLALGTNTKNDYTFYKLARCFADMKRYNTAQEYIDKALSLSNVSIAQMNGEKPGLSPSQRKYIALKNEIMAKSNPYENTIASSKPAEDFSRNRPSNYSLKPSKLNPNLKMIPEDPKVDYTELGIPQTTSQEVSYEPPSNFGVSKNIEKNSPKTSQNSIFAFIPATGKALAKGASYAKDGVVSVAYLPVVGFNKTKNLVLASAIKIHDKFSETKIASAQKEKPKKSSVQIASVDDGSNSIFGKNLNYYQAQEQAPQEVYPQQEAAYESPMQPANQQEEYGADYYNEKGIEYYKRDNLPKAENFFKKAIELKPMYPKAFNNLANIEVKRGNLDKAIEYENQAILIDPTYPEAYYNIALIYKIKKDFANEIAYLDKTVQADPKYYQAYFTRGLAYYNQGDYEQAKYNFKEVLKYKNDHYLACQNLGIIYANELNKTEAVNYLKTAIKLNKRNSSSYYYLATIYQATGSVFEAIDYFQKTIELNPENYKAYLALSKSYEQNDEIDRAIDTLNDAIRLNPSNPEPYNSIGLLLLQKDKYVEAANSFHQAVELNPKRPVYHYNLSQSYICLNMKTKAKSEFEAATNIQPTSVQDYIDLSEIFFDRGMPSYSIKILKDGIAALPDNDYLYVVLSKFYEKTGASASAKKLLSDYLVQKPNGTLSLLMQHKLSEMNNSATNSSDDDL